MENLKIVDAGIDGSVTFELNVSPNFSNLNDVMHGGAAGVIFGMYYRTVLSSWQYPATMFASIICLYLSTPLASLQFTT
jgi:hypothetical protein